MTYATEADMINVALFGCTAKDWRDAHPEEKGNIRDLPPVANEERENPHDRH